MNYLILILARILAIILGVYIALSYCFSEKISVGKLISLIIPIISIFGTMTYFYLIWNAENIKDILINICPFCTCFIILIDNFEKKKKGFENDN